MATETTDYPAAVDTLPAIPLGTYQDEAVGGRTHRQILNVLTASAIALETALGATAAATDTLQYVRRGNGAGKSSLVPDASLSPSPILNGMFNVWQFGTTFASIASGTYGPDGWVYAKVGAVVHDLLRSTDVPAVATPNAPLGNYSLHLDVTTVDASIAATDQCSIQYRMEGYDWGFFAQRQFTIGFWVKDTKTGIHCVAFFNGAGDRSYVAEYTVNVADTWEYKQVTVSASPSAGTWGYTTAIGMVIAWSLNAGSNFQTTAGAWQTGNFRTTANQVNATDSTANNFKLFGVTMGLGAYAPAPAFRPFAQELAFALRYYNKSFPYATVPAQNAGTTGAVGTTGAANFLVPLTFPAPMRVAPTVTTYNPSAANTSWRDISGSADRAAVVSTVSEYGLTLGHSAGFGVAGSFNFIHYTADARL